MFYPSTVPVAQRSESQNALRYGRSAVLPSLEAKIAMQTKTTLHHKHGGDKTVAQVDNDSARQTRVIGTSDDGIINVDLPATPDYNRGFLTVEEAVEGIDQ